MASNELIAEFQSCYGYKMKVYRNRGWRGFREQQNKYYLVQDDYIVANEVDAEEMMRMLASWADTPEPAE